MDRNIVGSGNRIVDIIVALRKESVDRNRLFIIGQYLVSVALRKESVDRNRTPHHMNTRPIPSLSARRAWIEIHNTVCPYR